MRSNGEIKWRGERVFLSETLIGDPVGLRATENGWWQIWYGPIRLACIDHRGRLGRHHPHSAGTTEACGLVDNAAAFPTTPQAQQPQPTA